MADSQSLTIVLVVLLSLVAGAGIFMALSAWRRGSKPHITPPPTPDPVERATPTPTPATPSVPHEDMPQVTEVDVGVVLSKLTFENVRSFSKLDMRFTWPATAGAGQWILLLGDNGMGKSTILRALVLGLVDPAISTAVLQTSQAPHVRKGKERAEIRVELSTHKYGVSLLSGRPFERLRPKDSDAERPGVFAYGPLRGSALGGAARQVQFLSTGSIATLFDETAPLINAETWLLQMRFAALRSKGGSEETFFDAVSSTVCALLPGVTSLDVTESGVLLTGPEVGDGIELAGMSDAYLGTLGWVLDLIARWSNRYRQLHDVTPDGSLLANARGLVIVDEIGLHLHPLWQTTIVSDLRKKFPKMTFVVTSHSPLVLLGAEAGEVHVLRRRPETHEVVLEQANVPPGTSADRILTGRWFNLPSTLDEGTRDLLQQHRQLLRQGKSAEDPEVEKLQDTLRGRLGSFADTSIDRMAFEVASQVIKETESTFDKLSPERREEIRQEMLQELRRRTSSGRK